MSRGQGVRRRRVFVGGVWLLLLTLSWVNAGAASPAALSDWSRWLSDQNPEWKCPRWNNTPAADASARLCLFPSELRLQLNNSGASFEYRVDVYGKSALAPLPGDKNSWPQNVTLNGSRASAVIERDGQPFMLLEAGRHRLRGELSWSIRPAFVSVPSEVVLLSAYQGGEWLPLERRGNRLMLTPPVSNTTDQQQDSISIEVYRKLSDGVPMQLETQLLLMVSGKNREVVLGPVVPADTLPMHLDSSLPARLEADGRLRLQLLPGTHRIVLRSRYQQPIAAFSSPALGTVHWPRAEFLSFEEDHPFRSVKLAGARSVDTSQINLPSQWRALPTYRIERDTQLELETETRGDTSPASNELNVQRDLWLDFSGQGFTTLDRIDGTMHQRWRLDAAPEVQIGRASVNGEPTVVTQYQGLEGLEIRSPSINLEAITRVEQRDRLPIVGWNAQAESVRATVHLPPAWKALHVSGAETAHGTWVSQWNLWEVFLLMVIVAATRRLFNLRVAVVATISYLLALQEPNSPLVFIPVLLIILALAGIANESVQRILKTVAVITVLALALGFVQFAVESFRLAIYPTLERASVGDYYRRSNPWEAEEDAQTLQELRVSGKSYSLAIPSKSAPPPADLSHYDTTETELVQTGPGQPGWTWRSLSLRFHGPVAADDTLRLYLLPPWATSLWRIFMVLCCGLLSAVIVHRLVRLMFTPVKGIAGQAAAVLCAIMGVSTLLPQSAQAQQYPPEYLLDRLESQLNQSPLCWPQCSAINGATLSADEDQVTLELELYSETAMVMPMPKAIGGLHWQSVRSGGQNRSLADTGMTGPVVALQPGSQKVQLEGRIAGDSWSLKFHVPVHNLTLAAETWSVGGWVNGRVQGEVLSFQRQPRQEQLSHTLRNDPEPPLVQVERHLVMARQWELVTTVTRLAPAEGPFEASVQLWPDEKRLSGEGEVRDGRVTVNFATQQNRVRWRSRLQPVSELHLRASEAANQVERWVLTPSDRWRLDFQGIPPNRGMGAQAHQSTFQPLPGEQLVVRAQAPDAVTGPSHTIEKITLDQIGGRSLEKTEATLSIRASLAEDFAFDVPAGAKVTRLTYAGKPLSLPEDQRILVTLNPGEHDVSVSFQQSVEERWLQRSAALSLQESSANLHLNYHLPRDRWPLYVSGPAIGPAMLFWGVLCVIVLGAVLLHQLARAQNLALPISITGWLLLGVGLSTVNSYGVLVVAVCFFALAVRGQKVVTARWSGRHFKLMQLGLVALASLTVVCLISAIPMGLLSDPEMKVTGNGSSSHLYHYYQDRAGGDGFPQVTVFSVPLIVYRAAMLLWSLWLATQLMVWARWGWDCYRQGGAWRSGRNPTATDQGQTASQQES